MYKCTSPATAADLSNICHPLLDFKEDKSGMSDSTPEMEACETDISYAR